MIEKIIVTRHTGLLDYLVQEGLAGPDTPVISHATADQVAGKHVLGVLPMYLAAEAAMVTEIPLALTPEMRGQELTADQMRSVAGDPATYQVRRVTE